MKKLFVLPFALAAVFVFAPSAEAKTMTNAANAHNTAASQVRVRYLTRNERIGRRLYRVTYRVSRYRNGRIVRQIVSRQLIRGGRLR